jgi:hypothetical protein
LASASSTPFSIAGMNSGRDRAALDLVDEVEALAGRRLDVDVDDAVLARATGLAHVAAFDLLAVPRTVSR